MTAGLKKACRVGLGVNQITISPSKAGLPVSILGMMVCRKYSSLGNDRSVQFHVDHPQLGLERIYHVLRVL